jgi:uncharacterized SAM-binding protein YcdF (DUF218 family)
MKRLLCWMTRLLALAGLVLATACGLALTGVPWAWYERMALPEPGANAPPQVIVMLGGGGIPSETGLVRSWKTADAARLFPDALVLVAMPDDGSETPEQGIEAELRMRGVAPERLRREARGRNTREQAVESMKLIRAEFPGPVVIGLVTTPEHMTRVWRSFRKAGAEQLVGFPAWPEAIEVDMSYRASELGGASAIGNVVGGSDLIKYRFWDNVILLLRCARETAAIAYYRAMDWL